MKRNFFVFIGPPCCGKGTQSGYFSREQKIPEDAVIGAGKILRDISNSHPLYQRVRKHMDLGEFVPDDIIDPLILEKIAGTDHNPVILDGYPRNLGQMEVLMGVSGGVNVVPVFLSVPMDVCEQRAMGRGRSDDARKDAFAKRAEEYRSKTIPLINRLADSANFIRINANRPEDEVWRSIRTRLAAPLAEIRTGTRFRHTLSFSGSPAPVTT